MSYHNRKMTAQGFKGFLDQIVAEAALAELQARGAIAKIMAGDPKNAAAQGWEQAPAPRCT
jgi:hypothetical protein